MKNVYTLFLFLTSFLTHAQFTYQAGYGFGNTGSDGGGGIAVDPSGNVYVAGTFFISVDMDPGAGTTTLTDLGLGDGFVARYSSSGTLLWAKALGGTMADGAVSVDVDTAGNVYVLGSFEGTLDLGGGSLTSAGESDFFVVKYDTNGGHSWSKRFGGTDNESPYVIKTDKAGANIVLCGSFDGTMDMGTGQLTNLGSSNAFVASLNGSGITQWSDAFGGNGFATDRAVNLALDNAGNAYVIGNLSGTNVDVDPGAGTHLLSSTGSSDIFLVKYNSAGVFQTALSLGGTTGELGAAVAVASNGDIYLTGYTNSDSMDADPSTDTTYLYADPTINSGQDLILIKLNANAEYQWSFRTGKRATDAGRAIHVDDNGDVLLTGTSGDVNVDIDPGPGIHYITTDTFPPNTSIAFVARYTSGGAFVDAFSLDSSVFAQTAAVTNDGKIWITGSFRSSSVDLDPGASAATFVKAGGFSDAFFAGYNYLPTVGIVEQSISHLKVYPVPATNTVVIESGTPYEGLVNIADISGRLVKQSLMKRDGSVSLEGLGAGEYFISAHNEKANFTARVIKIN